MQKVSVLGLGNWGTAIAQLLALKGFDVLGWSIEEQVVEGINSKHYNPVYQSQVKLSASVRATGDLNEALERNILVLVFPSSALKAIVPKLQYRKGQRLISAIKGFEAESLLTPLQYIESRYPESASSLIVFSGPSFAKDIVAGQPAGIVAGSKSQKAAKFVAESFSSSRLKVYTSTDPLGVELGGIVKNVIALAAGVCDGIGLGDSARAGLITRGLAEMMRLTVAMGAKEETLFGLSGLGDLVMTASCDTSRNRTVGLRLGRGDSLSDIVKTLGSVAEGVKTTPLVLKLAERFKVEMPISEAVSDLLSERIAPQEMLERLINRPLKQEF